MWTSLNVSRLHWEYEVWEIRLSGPGVHWRINRKSVPTVRKNAAGALSLLYVAHLVVALSSSFFSFLSSFLSKLNLAGWDSCTSCTHTSHWPASAAVASATKLRARPNMTEIVYPLDIARWEKIIHHNSSAYLGLWLTPGRIPKALSYLSAGAWCISETITEKLVARYFKQYRTIAE